MKPGRYFLLIPCPIERQNYHLGASFDHQKIAYRIDARSSCPSDRSDLVGLANAIPSWALVAVAGLCAVLWYAVGVCEGAPGAEYCLGANMVKRGQVKELGIVRRSLAIRISRPLPPPERVWGSFRFKESTNPQEDATEVST